MMLFEFPMLELSPMMLSKFPMLELPPMMLSKFSVFVAMGTPKTKAMGTSSMATTVRKMVNSITCSGSSSTTG